MPLFEQTPQETKVTVRIDSITIDTTRNTEYKVVINCSKTIEIDGKEQVNIPLQQIIVPVSGLDVTVKNGVDAICASLISSKMQTDPTWLG